MNDQTPREKHLTAVSGLIARSEIYRNVFARVALVSGLLSLLTALAIYWNDERSHFIGRTVRPREFAFAWMDVFFLSAVAAFLFLWRASRDCADVFPSTRTKLALSAIGPVLLIPAMFTAWFLGTGYLGAAEFELSIVWIASYGLALLSTILFAPRAIVLLGWAFLLTAVGGPVLSQRIDDWTGNVPITLLGFTFGGYHLLYAALNWKRSTAGVADTGPKQ